MKKRQHDTVVVAVAIAAAWFITPLARICWSIPAVPQSFSTSVLWLDYAYLSMWTFELVWAALFGFVLTRTLHSRATLSWSLLLGVGLGLLHVAYSSNWIAPDAALSRYIWAYGLYGVPTIGVLAGHWLARRVSNEGHANPNAA